VSLRNYYLKSLFDGGRVFRAGTALCAAVIVIELVLRVMP
jgi:hypothetical protein